mmetsp:Transcript_46184/g.86161  ORF Transcript_46184/g.86161 Transcript_46184/m.86161 type:complete len:229 (+) Transcript_46184:87-773(+)
MFLVPKDVFLWRPTPLLRLAKHPFLMLFPEQLALIKADRHWLRHSTARDLGNANAFTVHHVSPLDSRRLLGNRIHEHNVGDMDRTLDSDDGRLPRPRFRVPEASLQADTRDNHLVLFADDSADDSKLTLLAAIEDLDAVPNFDVHLSSQVDPAEFSINVARVRWCRPLRQFLADRQKRQLSVAFLILFLADALVKGDDAALDARLEVRGPARERAKHHVPPRSSKTPE